MVDDSTQAERRSLAQVARFLIVGGTNTLFTYVVFAGLGLLIDPWLAYTIAFTLGLLWTSFASSRFVFRVRFSPTRTLLFLGAYLVIYSIGLVIVRLIDPQTFVDLLITSLIILITTTPLVFLVGRLIFTRQAPGEVPRTNRKAD